MHKVLILGAGKIGALISGLLAESGDYDVTLGDVDAKAAEAVVKLTVREPCGPWLLTPSDAKALDQHFAAFKPHAVISSLPYYCNPAVAKAARKGNAHYFDLTEDVEVTKAVRRIARGASKAFVPAMRTRARLHQHRRERAREAFRRAALDQAARRRAAAAP